MIVEMRTYRLKPAATATFFKLYESEGMPIQLPILGMMVGYYATELGPLNQIVHMWGYKDLADRTRRRTKLSADKRWQAFAPKVQALIDEMENKILVPAPFFTPGEIKRA